MVLTRKGSTEGGKSPKVTRGRNVKYIKGENGRRRKTLGKSPPLGEAERTESSSQISDDDAKSDDSISLETHPKRPAGSRNSPEAKGTGCLTPSLKRTFRGLIKTPSNCQSSSDEAKGSDSVTPRRTLRQRQSVRRYSDSHFLPSFRTEDEEGKYSQNESSERTPPLRRSSRSSTPTVLLKKQPSHFQSHSNVKAVQTPSPPRLSRRSSANSNGKPTMVLKNLPSDSQNMSNVKAVRTPSPPRRSRRRSSSEKHVTPAGCLERLSIGTAEREDTPIIQTPKRRRRASTDAQDTPSLPSSVRQSRRVSGGRVVECKVPSEVCPTAFAKLNKPVEEEPSPSAEDDDGQMDSMSSALSLESISEEEEDVLVTHSGNAIQEKSAYETEELQILKSKPEILPVIEEEQVEVDSSSETSDSAIAIAERKHTPKSRTKALTVIEKGEEKHVSSDSLPETEEIEEKVIKKSVLLSKVTVEDDSLTEEPTEKLDEKEDEEEVYILYRGIDGNSDCSVSSVTGTDKDNLVVEEKDISVDAIGGNEKAKVVKSTIKSELIEKNIVNEESIEKMDKEGSEVNNVDQGIDGGNNCSISSLTAMNKNDLVVADETVSTTVTTDEDYASTLENEIKSEDLDTALDKGSEEVPSKDREVSSTTDIGVKDEDQENELLNSQQTEGGNQKKKEPVINEDSTGISIDSVVLDTISQIKIIPRGLPVSGRWWKKEKQSFRSINKDATGKKSWGKKMKLKQERQNVMAKSAALQEEKQRKKDELKKRQQLNKIRREENAKKSEIVQVIRDSRKIKKMKRKQLRYIEKRDTTQLQS